MRSFRATLYYFFFSAMFKSVWYSLQLGTSDDRPTQPTLQPSLQNGQFYVKPLMRSVATSGSSCIRQRFCSNLARFSNRISSSRLMTDECLKAEDDCFLPRAFLFVIPHRSAGWTRTDAQERRIYDAGNLITGRHRNFVKSDAALCVTDPVADWLIQWLLNWKIYGVHSEADCRQIPDHT